MDYKMTRGDSKTIITPLADAAGDPIDLTDCTVWFTAKAAYTDTDEAATFQKSTADGITVIDEDTGVIQVDIEPEDTEDLDGVRTRLLYDIQVKDGDGKVSTAQSGKLVVYPDVTISTEDVS
jgi:hypothetical protein